MAEIRPFRAWRYNEELSAEIGNLTSPLFDVVSERQRKRLYEIPYNSIHLSVPLNSAPAEQAAELLKQWKKSGILQQDDLPSIYVYYQYFTLSGSDKEFCRKGFISLIRAYDWDDGVIFRHENTMPRAVNDRVELLNKTDLNVSPTHGLYSDPGFELERYMDESMLNPLYETEDYQGVRDVLSVIQDQQVINRFISLIRDKEIILADGHHRYEGSLIHKQRKITENGEHKGSEGYNYHMMYLTNAEAHDLRILPTHRLIKGLPNFSEEELLKKLEHDFIIKPIEDAYMINEIILGKKWAFGLLFKENTYKIRLKPEVFHTMAWKFPEVIKALDLTILHYFVIEKVLGIPGKEQTTSDQIEFDRSFPDCLAKVIRGEAQLGLIIKDISMDDIKKVCRSGYTMPQKSTYMYPKVICGFLFGSIQEDEFRLPTNYRL